MIDWIATLGEPILTVDLPHELTNGNDGRGGKFWNSARMREEIEYRLRIDGQLRAYFEFPTFVVITRVLGKRQVKWDFDSVLRGSAKELLDALVACGWWHDDSPKYIYGVYGAQDDTRRSEGPTTMIQIWDARP